MHWVATGELLLPASHHIVPMARRSKSNGRKIQKAEKNITLILTSVSGVATDVYLDIAEQLSKINRRGYDQGWVYGVQSVEISMNANPSLVDFIGITAYTAGDTWVVHNAHTKGKALHREMQELVLADNPSIKGKWADFKVYLDDAHLGGTKAQAIAGDGALVEAGEWDYSTFVMPQHDVDPVTGEPLTADETFCHLIGGNLGAAGSFTSVGLVTAYALSRSTVQPESPNVHPNLVNSFFNLLTDSGSQEPELAAVIIGENDEPPYAAANYPGGTVNSDVPWITETAYASSGSPNAVLSPFVAQCGLVKLSLALFKDGQFYEGPPVPIVVRLTLMPGNYKGVAAIPMGQ